MCALKAEYGWPEGDRPGALKFKYRRPAPVADAIKRCLPSDLPGLDGPDIRLGALNRSTGPVGSYRIATACGNWFVRVSSRLGNAELERSITAELTARGVNVNPLVVADRRLHWKDDVYRVDVRPMLEGRHFNRSRVYSRDLQRLATTLVACHRVLVHSQHTAAVRTAASERNEQLAKIRDLLVEALKRDSFELFGERARWAKHHRKWLATMAERFDPHLDRRPDAQCLHGQVHPGNVVFRSGDGAAVLVDFEESVQIFAPPAWDVAVAVQRFCLANNPALATARQRLAMFARAYGRGMPNLAEMMRQAAWFSIAVILNNCRSHGIVAPVGEYNKFVRLERQTRTYESLL
jgi:Ser/Thr protein kinase RdoA (MazF antagonist)